jgi:hypothetical protein
METADNMTTCTVDFQDKDWNTESCLNTDCQDGKAETAKKERAKRKSAKRRLATVLDQDLRSKTEDKQEIRLSFVQERPNDILSKICTAGFFVFCLIH